MVKVLIVILGRKMMFEIESRESLTVYLQHAKDVRKIRRFGDVIYQSKRLGYVVLYIDSREKEQIMAKLAALRVVKEVRESQLDQIDHDFVGSLTRSVD